MGLTAHQQQERVCVEAPWTGGLGVSLRRWCPGLQVQHSQAGVSTPPANGAAASEPSQSSISRTHKILKKVTCNLCHMIVSVTGNLDHCLDLLNLSFAITAPQLLVFYTGTVSRTCWDVSASSSVTSATPGCSCVPLEMCLVETRTAVLGFFRLI